MDTQRKTWLVVADSAKAYIYRVGDKDGSLDELDRLTHERSEKPDRELTSDRPGRVFDSAGTGRHAMDSQVDPQEQEARNFSKEVSSLLDEARTRNKFEQLVLVAAPAFLGLLRKDISSETADKVVLSINKNLTHLNATEIQEALGHRLTA